MAANQQASGSSLCSNNISLATASLKKLLAKTSWLPSESAAKQLIAKQAFLAPPISPLASIRHRDVVYKFKQVLFANHLYLTSVIYGVFAQKYLYKVISVNVEMASFNTISTHYQHFNFEWLFQVIAFKENFSFLYRHFLEIADHKDSVC